MAAVRSSLASQSNKSLREERPKKTERNAAWLRRHGDSDGILLLGGTSVADFRIRVAQSSLRRDMAPSFWSQCGILLEGGIVATVPLDFSDPSDVPSCNGVRRRSIDEYDDPQRFPNIAVIRFAETHDNAIRDIGRVEADRSLVDLPSLMLPWLGFVWGGADAANPLLSGQGLPSAAFVETVFAMAGFDLTPGVSSASSCPEAIWQSAKWWAVYYQGAAEEARTLRKEMKESGGSKDGAKSAAAGSEQGENVLAAVPMVPTGVFTVRQVAAAVRD